MVGWIPPVLKDRAERLQEFSQRLNACHDVGPNDTAFILHYDSGVGDMRPYFWPSDETDQRVKPPALNSLRLTHLFKGPSCYCAWLQGGRYTEAKIGLALRTGGPSGISDACLGQFVAICAEQRCGYFVSLDKFYSHRRLATRKYIKRKEPLRTLNPFHFVTGDTEDSVKRTGLRQVEVLRDDPQGT
ncbi:hypothetical protein FA13DRAFT_1803877 [Coprinellus micaceus]|uniref:Uncharacterized protein n=1 Tax=Coprinellus micaceus TaxID=71717 RepID=A0A4Y7SA04_COPMI|nr:hypothetical protein FA13DRAFT_1803877 [Coprinellus micaceus]